MSCLVSECMNHTKNRNPSNVKFYGLPAKEPYRSEWLRVCGIGENDKIPIKSAVCSIHFQDSDLAEKSVRQKIMNYSPPRCRKIKSTAIPSLFLPLPKKKFHISKDGYKEAARASLIKRTTKAIVDDCSVIRISKTAEDLDVDVEGDLDIEIPETGINSNDIEENRLTEMEIEINSNDNEENKVTEMEIEINSNDNEENKVTEMEMLLCSYAPSPYDNNSQDKSTQTEINSNEDSENENRSAPSLIEQELTSSTAKNLSAASKYQNLNDDLGVALMENFWFTKYKEELDKNKKKEEEEEIMKRDESELFAKSFELEMLQQNYESFKKEMEKKDQEIKYLQEQIKERDDIVNRFFTKAQLDRILKNKFTSWSKDDIASAIAMRSMGPKLYRHLRKVKNWPLPACSTLRKWCLKLQLKSGVDDATLRIMEAWGKDLKDIDKLCVLTFDEMAMSDVVMYDPSEKRIVGPHSKVQVVMVRGLISNWKQPIFFDFDRKMTPELYFEIVKKLFAVNFKVVATTCDMGNHGFWTAMGINTHKTWVSHPNDENAKIYFFADVPHLIKLVRNHFIDQGFRFPGEKYISRNGFDAILNASPFGNEITMAYKIDRSMLDVEGSARMKVSPAAKLFSNTNANVVALYSMKEYITYGNALYLGGFIRLVNKWFDVQNSSQKSGAYSGTKAQKKVLNDMNFVMANMRVEGHQSTIPFQNGIIVSNKSLMDLFDDLKKSYGIEYLLTRRLNQDCLENFFGFIRAMGRANDHPTPVEFKYRLRLYLLRKHAAVVLADNTNCEKEVDENEEILITLNMVEDAFPDKSTSKDDILFGEELNDDDLKTFEADFEALIKSFEKSEETAQDIENAGLAYLSGYTAFRLLRKYPQLGTPTKNLKDVQVSPWISINSNGNLIQPSEELFAAVKAIEEVFIKIHGHTGFNGSSKILENTVKYILKSKPETQKIPKEAVELFVRTRMNLRIRAFNKNQDFSLWQEFDSSET